MKLLAFILLGSLAIATVSSAGLRLSNNDIEKSIENLPSHHEKYKKHFMKVDTEVEEDETEAPTDYPTDAPTDAPTTIAPTAAPTTAAPTDAPTDAPTTAAPTDAPTTLAPTTAAPTTAPRPPCPDDWIEHWNHDLDTFTCFKFLGAASHEQKVETWFQAQQACEGLVVEGFEGTPFLAEPYVNSIHEFLIDIAEFEAEFTKVNTWYLGLSDLGSPDDSAANTRDCGIMMMSGASHEGFIFGWTDVECDKHIGEAVPICQLYPLVQAPTQAPTTPEPSF